MSMITELLPCVPDTIVALSGVSTLGALVLEGIMPDRNWKALARVLLTTGLFLVISGATDRLILTDHDWMDTVGKFGFVAGFGVLAISAFAYDRHKHSSHCDQ